MAAPKPPAFDAEIRTLYHGPLAEFTPGRQALGKRLRREGDSRAGAVAELRKPTPSAWAVGRLFAVEARAMAALVAAGEEARAAPARGGDDAGRVRQALERIRVETARLLDVAAALLTGASDAPSAAIRERIRQNLEALALDPANAPLAARGWLDADLEAPGFEVMAALQIAADRGGASGSASGPARASRSAPPRRPSPAIAERERRERVAAAQRALARAEKRAAELRETAAESAHTAERAAFAAAQAAQHADETRRAAQEAKRAAEAAAEEVTRAREALHRAERT